MHRLRLHSTKPDSSSIVRPVHSDATLATFTQRHQKHGKIYTKKVHAELEALLTGPPEDIVMKHAAIHKGVRTKPRNRSIVTGREPLGLFEPNGPHFPKE